MLKNSSKMSASRQIHTGANMSAKKKAPAADRGLGMGKNLKSLWMFLYDT